MSDVNGATGAPKSSAKPKASNLLRELASLMRKLPEKDISDVDQLINDKKDLEQKILSNNQELAARREELTSLKSATGNEIAKLRSEKEVLIDAFAERVKNWSAEANKSTALEGDIDELKQQLGQANERASFLQAQLSRVTIELSEKEAELERAKRDLLSCESTLQDERQELGLEYLNHEAL